MASVTLSSKEIELIRESWKPVQADTKGSGIFIFKNMFGKFPEYKALFKRYDEPGKDIFENEGFIKHVTVNVMGWFDKAIANLEADEEVKPLLNLVADRHKPRDVTAQHFKNLGVVLVEALEACLKDSFTPEVKAAWSKFLTQVMDGVIAARSA